MAKKPVKDNEVRELRGALAQFTEEEICDMMTKAIKKCTPGGEGQVGVSPAAARKHYEWDNDLLLIRRQFILDLYARGWSARDIDSYLMQNWECGKTTSIGYRKDALKELVETNQEVIDHHKNIQIDRIEKMINECVAQNKYKEAAMFTEMLNKLEGLYIDRSEVVIKDYQTTFKFGDE